jgi:outer membrane protein OmpA-like peptidoglycan-associated protein
MMASTFGGVRRWWRRGGLSRLLMLCTATIAVWSVPFVTNAKHVERNVQGRAHGKAGSSRGNSNKQKWHVRAERHISFQGNSAALSRADEHDLLLIARAAQVHTDYVLCVIGYAHSFANGAANQLSNQRVRAVTKFLERSGEVSPNRLLSAAAMQALNVAVVAPHSTSADDPRAVTVRVLARSGQL